MKRVIPSGSAATPAKQLATFLAKLEPAVAKTVRSARAMLRDKFPTAHELVYDNYNFFVIGFCTTERASDCFVSLAANSKGVNLNFYYGAALEDPHRLLQGSGKQNRFLRLESAETLKQPDVQELIRAAVDQSDPPLVSTGRGGLVIRAIAAKQRPRRLHR